MQYLRVNMETLIAVRVHTSSMFVCLLALPYIVYSKCSIALGRLPVRNDICHKNYFKHYIIPLQVKSQEIIAQHYVDSVEILTRQRNL